MSGWVPPAVDPPIFEFYAVRTEGTLRVIDPQHTSWDELAAILSENEDFVARCTPYHMRLRQGFWSYVYETEHRGVEIQPLTKRWSEDDLVAAREFLFSDQFEDSSSGYWVSSFRDVAAQDRSTHRILWLGVAHDAFALLTFTALLYSFTGWPAWFAAHPWSRRNRRLLRGLCPECGYDIRGLSTCPECGTARDETPE
ncbi:MAG: hypothetical protein ACF8R9_07815 [Phycisphaerales bacterium JB054]